jgi:YbbR domain-containing protein
MITFLRDLVFKDWWLKLFSLILAALIYFTIYFVGINPPNEGAPFTPAAMASGIRILDHVPVLVMCSADEARQFRVNPEQVAVTVQGDPQVLARLRSDEIRAWVDLTGLESASDLPRHIEVIAPPGVTRTHAVPAEVRVLFPPKR